MRMGFFRTLAMAAVGALALGIVSAPAQAALDTAGFIDVGDFRFQWLGYPSTCFDQPICANANVVAAGSSGTSASISLVPIAPPLVGAGQDIKAVFNITSLSGRDIVGFGALGLGTPNASAGIDLLNNQGDPIVASFTVPAGSGLSEIFFASQSNVIAQFDIRGNNGGFNSFTFTVHATPEPGTMALIGVGVAALAMVRRRRV